MPGRVLPQLAIHRVATLPAASSQPGGLLRTSAGLHFSNGTAWLRLDFGDAQTGNRVFASPNGGPGAPGFRALTALDIPNLDAGKIATGTLATARGGTGITTPFTANRFLFTGSTTTIIQADAGQALAVLGLTDGGWVVPTLQNSWVNYGASYAAAGHRKVGSIVYLRGSVKSGTTAEGTPLFTLPAGSRPPSDRAFACVQYSGSTASMYRLVVASSGQVLLAGLTTNFQVVLDGAFFHVD